MPNTIWGTEEYLGGPPGGMVLWISRAMLWPPYANTASAAQQAPDNCVRYGWHALDGAAHTPEICCSLPVTRAMHGRPNAPSSKAPCLSTHSPTGPHFTPTPHHPPMLASALNAPNTYASVLRSLGAQLAPSTLPYTRGSTHAMVE
jgi:hypothetical protein